MAPAKTPTFPATQNDKRTAGATAVTQTPLSIRALRLTLSMGLEDHIRETLSRKLGPAAATIERLTVRFEDVNGPKGGVDFLCTAKVSLSAVPSVVVTGTGRTDREAFNAVTEALARAVRTKIDRANAAGRVAPRRKTGPVSPKPAAKPAVKPAAKPAVAKAPVAAAGSRMDRGVGRGKANLKDVLERPEKKRRDQPVDTAAVGVSATDRKAGGDSTARRNSKAKTGKATAMLEDSTNGRPSRKSTRRSANSQKSATQLERKASAKARTPKAKAVKANAKAIKTRGKPRVIKGKGKGKR